MASGELTDEQVFGAQRELSDAEVFGPPRAQGPSAIGAVSQGINVGLTNMLGAPADIGNAALSLVGLGSERPVSGGARFREYLNMLKPGMAYQDIKDVPEDLRPIAKGAEVIGGSVPIAAAPFATRKALTELPSIVRPIVQAAREAPAKFAAVEAGGAAGAAQGAALAELFAPGSSLAGFAGEVAGGFVNPLGLATRGVSRGISEIKNVARSFTKPGREAKAAELIQKAMIDAGEDPAAVAKLLREADLSGVSLTAGQKADSPTLLAFETTLASKSPEFDAAAKLKTKESFAALRKLIGQLETSGDPALVREAAKTRDRYFRTLLDSRMQAAEREAQRTASTLGGDKAAASARVTQILDDSLTDARKVERSLWEAVPKDYALPGTGVIEAHSKVRSAMLPEEPLPPSFVEHFVARVKDGNGVSSGDIQRFRSQMLMKAREARGQKKWGDARIYEDMADGALADLAEVPGKASAEARDWSRTLNEAFTRTFAGDALAVKSTGAERIAPEAVLERAFGSGGTLANKRFAEMQEAATVSGPKAGLVADQEEFLRAAASAVTDPQTGTVNPRALEGFLKKNEVLLKRFPALRRDLKDASTAEQTFRDVQEATKFASKQIQNRAAFGTVLANESPSDAVRSVVNSSNPLREYEGLVKLARHGPQGSVDGLKAATLDYASRSATNATGDFSFARYREILNKPLSGTGPNLLSTMQFNKVMSADETSRLNAILRHAERIERSVASKTRMGELIGEPDALFDLVVRAVGANIGGMSALGQASGAPIVIAGAGSKAARNLFEKMPRTRVLDVMIEAAKNPPFMARLLEKPATPARARDVHKQINAFLIQAGLTPEVQESETQQ